MASAGKLGLDVVSKQAVVIEALNDTIDLLFGGARQPPRNPFHRGASGLG